MMRHGRQRGCGVESAAAGSSESSCHFLSLSYGTFPVSKVIVISLTHVWLTDSLASPHHAKIPIAIHLPRRGHHQLCVRSPTPFRMAFPPMGIGIRMGGLREQLARWWRKISLGTLEWLFRSHRCHLRCWIYWYRQGSLTPPLLLTPPPYSHDLTHIVREYRPTFVSIETTLSPTSVSAPYSRSFSPMPLSVVHPCEL